MSPVTVLVIDDEPQIRRAVRNALTSGGLLGPDVRMPLDAASRDTDGRGGVRVIEAATGREGIDLAAAESPALTVLDLGLPDMPGIEVCREIRRWSAAPIIVLSARHADTEKVALLDAGADDYLTKPFSTIEFMARARAQLRRAQAGAPNESLVTFGDRHGRPAAAAGRASGRAPPPHAHRVAPASDVRHASSTDAHASTALPRGLGERDW